MAAWLLILQVGFGVAATGRAASLQDNFAAREVVNEAAGQVSGTNVGATREAREPQHGGRVGGGSVWISWVAPGDGIATIDTVGSDFNTLLGVYTIPPGDEVVLDRLKEVARNDDDLGGVRTSRVQFGATGGVRYEIAVDGFEGAAGNIRLNWDLALANDPPPVFLNVPDDRAAQLGDTLSLTVDFQAGRSVKLAWFFNNVEIPNAESPTLVLPNFQRANVGLYTLRITSGDIRYFTRPIEIQVNSEGLTASLARDRLLDAPGSGVKVEDRVRDSLPGLRQRRVALQAATGVARGYNGTQIFNTTFATRDPNEPAHCGVVGGGSYWFAYQAPVAGTVALDTTGSELATVLAVYTYDPPLAGYDGLRPVVCDPGTGSTSRVQFAAEAGRNYLAVTDGAGGGRGIIHLNYALSVSSDPPPPPPPPPVTAPAIVLAPADQTVAPGAAALFRVEPSGTPPFSYQWRKEGIPLPGATSEALSLAAVAPADAGLYSVDVSNSAGTVTSRAARLTVLAAPSVLSPPAGRAVAAGATLVLTVDVAGSAPFRFQWYKDGVPIPAATASSLLLASVGERDSGRYTVEVFNAAGQVTSAPAVVEVLAPPVIVRHPSDSTVPLGRAVTFDVAVSGSGPLAFQWRRDDVVIPGATDPTLTLAAVGTDAAGTYSVDVSNALGSARSAPAALRILLPPVIVTPPAAQSVTPGGRALFVVAVTGGEPLTFEWRKEGAIVEGATASAMLVENVTSADAGTYTVTVANAAGTASASATLAVPVRPSIIVQPAGRTVIAGTDVTLSVIAAGSEPLTFQWRKDGAPIPGASHASLELRSVGPGDAGRYGVLVGNGIGTTASAVVVLEVLVPPSISVQPVGATVALGTPVSFTVSATGSAPLRFQWRRDGEPLAGADDSTLVIGSATLGVAGRYQVEIANGAGSVVSEAVALGIFTPPTVAWSAAEGMIEISFSAAGPVPFVIESSDTLRPDDWREWNGGVSVDGGGIRFSADPAAAASRFFRVRFR